MTTPAQPAGVTLASALGTMLRHPFSALVEAWNWKSAAISALFRALIFLTTNLRGTHRQAIQATIVEAAFAIIASGFLGAATQRLRAARPVWATALVVWLLLPALMSFAQFGVHHVTGTPHIRAGLIASFLFAVLASGFTWFAMRNGALLAGAEHSSLASDARKLPHLLMEFLLAVPRSATKGKS